MVKYEVVVKYEVLVNDSKVSIMGALDVCASMPRFPPTLPLLSI